jgi:hypothetical protein
LSPRFIGGAHVSRFIGGPHITRDALANLTVGATDPSALRVLCVHGVGDHHSDTTWQQDWALAIYQSVADHDASRRVAVDFLMYDDIFQKANYQISAPMVASAVWQLSVSGVVNGIQDLFHRGRGLRDVASQVRWTAGMIVQWADQEDLRAETRKALGGKIQSFDPHIICAHSLGSLVTYDTLVRDDGPLLARGRRLVTLGSQIGNPFVRNTFGGRIVPLAVDLWYHLYNRHDQVFTSDIRLPPRNFVQIETAFDIPGITNHDAISYLRHERTANRCWRELAAPAFEPIARTFAMRRERADKPKRRALLVGINDYPNPDDRLEGCVNDVFMMSALLQEMGFEANEIRVVLNDRATAAGIHERLQWLLSGVADDPDDQRLFYYSGHGAQLPVFGPSAEADHVDECLVPYDFDWTPEHAFTDDEFFELYSQLPYGSRFIAIFDCCHAGGMTRDGIARVRGISPPDDIRHRALRWDANLQMWVQREFADSGRPLAEDRGNNSYVGDSGAKHRLGRAIPLRRQTRRAYNREHQEQQAAVEAVIKKAKILNKSDRQRLAAAGDNRGPFMPVLLEACKEGELSYEYRHGVESHGAFTFLLDRALREARRRKQKLTFEQLRDQIGANLHRLKYPQTPCLVGPKKVLGSGIPFWSR